MAFDGLVLLAWERIGRKAHHQRMVEDAQVELHSV
jgi:hypothetical protein